MISLVMGMENGLTRTHVSLGPDTEVGHDILVGRETEVRKIDFGPVFVRHNVLGLEVPVVDVGLVAGLDGIDQGEERAAQQLVLAQVRLIDAHLLVEAAALAEVEDDVEVVVVLKRVIDLNDVPMV